MAVDALTAAVVVGKTATLVLGGLVTHATFRAYRRTGSRHLRTLCLGFGVVTLGALLAGVVDQLSAFDPSWALLVESLLTATGFLVVAYAAYGE